MIPTDEEAPTNEEQVPLDPPKSQKDRWYKSDIVIKWVSACAAVFIPIVIWLGSCQIQESISRESVAKDYVVIATTILERPKQEGDDALRDWATNLLVHHAPKGDEFNPKAQEQLKGSGLGPGVADWLNNLVSSRQDVRTISASPDGKRIARVIHRPDLYKAGSTFAEVYDLGTRQMISQFLVAPMLLEGLTLAWSQDGSKLLVGSNDPYLGSVRLFDVAQGKQLAEYVTKESGSIDDHGHPTGGSHVKELSVSEDGRSVSIKREDGKTEVWQLP